MRQKNKLRKRAKNLAEQSQHLNLAKFNSHIHNSLNSQTFEIELLKNSDGPQSKQRRRKKATNKKKVTKGSKITLT